MRASLVVLVVCSVSSLFALIPPGAADSTTAEGWRAMGFPVDDYVPWSLQIDSKEIANLNEKYLVVAGYLVASKDSITLFPTDEASKSGSIDGALVLTSDDSPALRWLLSDGSVEGHFAVGGLFSRAKGPALGHLTKVRFAMSRGPNQALQPTPMLVTPRADARVAPSTGVADL